MKEIPVGSDVAAIESSVKNEWRWAWLTEDEDGDIFGTWCKKTDQPGACLCMVCHKSLTYRTSGKRALVVCVCVPPLPPPPARLPPTPLPPPPARLPPLPPPPARLPAPPPPLSPYLPKGLLKIVIMMGAQRKEGKLNRMTLDCSSFSLQRAKAVKLYTVQIGVLALNSILKVYLSELCKISSPI